MSPPAFVWSNDPVATKLCPACGAEYVETVTSCADCQVPLIEEPPPAALLSDESDEDLVYELNDWTAEERSVLEMKLNGAGVAHRWEFGPGSTPGAEIGFSASEGTTQRRVWETAYELVVRGEDEATVDQLLDEVEFPEELEAVEDDVDDGSDEASYAVMSNLFVATDRLQHDPADVAIAGEFYMASEPLTEAPAPYGVEPALWTQIKEMTAAIDVALQSDAEDDEAIARDAAALRQLLSRYV